MVSNGEIQFNRPHMTGKELSYISEAHSNSMLAGNGPFTKRCNQLIEQYSECGKALLTHSCTAALEMAAILLDIKSGDEVIMPSYTFVSTANAFVLRGGIPVFVDIREDTLNLDEGLIEGAITERTKAIIPVHYAGVACEMDKIINIAKKHDLKVIEDAAQGIMATYKGRPLGGIGDLAAYSFHETKNVICGEGGALLINDDDYFLKAEVIHEKGTNRNQFSRGEVDKYRWYDIGSSFTPGELAAAFLLAQLEEAGTITRNRITMWEYYHEALEPLENEGILRRPIVPADCQHNGHMYYVLLAQEIDRNQVLDELNANGINAVFHYVPLHDSPGGQRFGQTSGELNITNRQSSRLIRLPIWVGLSQQKQNHVVDTLGETLHSMI